MVRSWTEIALSKEPLATEVPSGEIATEFTTNSFELNFVMKEERETRARLEAAKRSDSDSDVLVFWPLRCR